MVDTILPGSETAFLLGDVTRLWRQAFETGLAASAVKLTGAEMRTLAYVARGGGVNQKRLAEMMSVEPMTVSGTIESLESAGLLRRETDPADRRARLVFATPASEAIFDAAAPIAAQAYQKATDGLEPAEREALTSALKRMRANLAD